MRSRYIKPGFFTSEQLSECSPFARILFEGLWCYADRRGRLEDRPKKIKVAILPYDNVEIEELLGELVSNELIVRYEAEGKRYIWVPNFLLHQRPHYNEEDSVIPPCEQEIEMWQKGIIKSDAEEKAAKAAKEGKKSQVKQPKVESTCDQGGTDLLPRSQELATKVESTCDQGNKDFALENLILENLRTRELDTGELDTGEKKNTDTSLQPKPEAAASAAPASPSDCPHESIVELYHEILPMLPRVKVWNDARRSMLRTRWREDRARQNLDWWRWYFKLVAASDFLCGRCPPDKNGRTFTADLEWLIKPTNMPKVLEGKYSNRKHADVFEQAKRLGYDEIKRQAFGSFGSLRDEIIDIDGEVPET